MVKSLLNKIKKDLEGQLDLKSINNLDKFSLHFGVCKYIRNKYLWNSPAYKRILSEYFKELEVDALSYKILKEILKLD